MPTTKTRSNGLVSFYAIQTKLPNGSNWFPYVESLVNNRRDDTRTGDYLRDWRARISRGDNATTTMSASKLETAFFGSDDSLWESSSSPGGPVAYRTRFVGNYSTTMTIPVHSGASSTARAEYIALKRLYSAIKEVRNQFSGLTFLGEIRDTIRLVRHPADTFARGIERFNKDLSRYARGLSSGSNRGDNLARLASNLWLERSFGWLPLMNDTRNIAIAVARASIETRHTMVRGYGDDRAQFRNLLTPNSVGVNQNQQTAVTTSELSEVIYRAGLKANAYLPLGSAHHLVELLGFNISEFVPTVWELIPYSFVIDYFVNVGDMLSASLTDTSYVAWQGRTVRTTVKTVRDSVLTPIRTDLHKSSSGTSFGSVGAKLTSVNRAPLSSIPSLPVSLTLPGTANRYANLGALLVSATKSVR